MKTVGLIVPSQTYRADAYLGAAHRLGVDVVTISDTGQAMSSVMGDHFLEVDLEDPIGAARAIEALSRRLHLDAVIAVDDGGALTAAHAAQQLDLVHNSPKAIEATRDKQLMRSHVANSTVTQPDFRVIANGTHDTIANLVGDASDAIGYPVVIKPTGLSASRGVIRANDRDESEAAGIWSLNIARSAGAIDATLLVESFVVGDEIAFEGRLRSGELQCLAIFDKPDPLDGPFFEETIYVRPSALSTAIQQRITDDMQEVCRAMDLTEGPIHGEVRISPRGTASSPTMFFIEVAARTIGGRCAKALSFNGAMSIEEIVIGDALRIEFEPITTDETASGVLMLPIPQSGRLIAVANQEQAAAVPGIVGIEITVAPGRVLRSFPESDRYLGFVFAKASSSNDVVQALREAEKLLDVQVDTNDLDDSTVRR